MNKELSLFLLDTVLFPSMQLPLQVFEPRYLSMIQRCLDEDDWVFGVNLIRSGPEVGGPAEPMRIGTTARILSSQNTEDGRILLMTRGERRFRIQALDKSGEYLRAKIEYLEDTREPGDTELGREVLGIFRNVLEEMGLNIELDEEMLDEAERISYLVAAHLNRPNPDKQRLLEFASTSKRLALEKVWLEELLTALRSRKQVEKVAGRNGKLHHDIG